MVVPDLAPEDWVAQHRATEHAEVTETSESALSEQIIGAAIEVHRHLGPALLESAYHQCHCRELELRGLSYRPQVPLALEYKGVRVRNALRADLLVNDTILVELKAVERLDEVHRVQLLTYLRLTHLHVGLVINFNTPVLWKGVRRVVNGY